MPPDPDCLFCRIVAGDIPSTRVYEDERTVAFMDINPATRGHLLVVPRAHARDLLVAAPVNLLSSSGAAAWKTVFHLHFHVIPRYEDDPLRLPWVPGAGDPDEIAATAAALTE